MDEKELNSEEPEEYTEETFSGKETYREKNVTEDSEREKMEAEKIGMNSLEQVSGGTDPLADIPRVKLYPYDDDIRKKV